MLSAHRHPEFGYLCPSSTLWRVFQGAVAFAVVGAIVGASSVGALIADLDAGATLASFVAEPVAAAGAHATSVPRPKAETVAARIDPAGIPASSPRRIEPAVEGGAASAPGGTLTGTGTGTAVAGRPGCEAGMSEPPGSDAAAPSTLARGTWAYLDGKCEAGRMRKVRLARKDMPAVTEEPAITRTRSGRSAVRAGAPTARPSAKPATTSPMAVTATQDPFVQATVSARRPARTVDARGRARDGAQAPREARLDPRRAPGNDVAQNPFAALFGNFR